MTVETKRALFGDVAIKADDDDLGENEFLAIMSDPSIDRDGEKILVGAFDPLPDRIPVDIDHELTAEGTVGSGVPFYDGDKLMIRGTFASDARSQELRQKVLDGHVSKMSVAFRAADREFPENADDPVLIRKAELLNVAFVAIPSNRNADVIAAKSADTVEESTAIDGDSSTADTDSVDEVAAKGGEAAESAEFDAEAERAKLKAEVEQEVRSALEVEKREAMLRTVLDPEFMKKRFTVSGIPGDALADLLHDAKGVALVVIPEGVDYVEAAKAAQDAVDQFSTAPVADAPDAAAAADEVAAAAEEQRAARARETAMEALGLGRKRAARFKGF